MPRKDRIQPAPAVVARLGAIALALPEVYEEDAWTGVRWRIRSKTIAHVMEKASDVGGVWRENTYPGAACDVKSHM